MIYVIGRNRQNSKTVMVKVGRSLNPERRLKELQTGSPFVLSILAIGEGGSGWERQLHRELSRFNKAGEWFLLPRNRLKRLINDVENPPKRFSDPNRKSRKPKSPSALEPRDPSLKAFSKVKVYKMPLTSDNSIIKSKERGPLGHSQWEFTCADCGVVFHRTSQQAAEQWQTDHARLAHPRVEVAPSDYYRFAAR